MNMYFLAVVAPPEIGRQVVKWKTWMKEHYGCLVALRSPAHITLVPPFWMKPDLEKDLQHDLDVFSATQNRFLLQLFNFSHFDNRVIFIDVPANDALNVLHDELYHFLLREKKYPVQTDTRLFHPHVTIATRDLHKKAFQEAWEQFREIQYNAEWKVENISLLKNDKQKWEVITTSSFKQV